MTIRWFPAAWLLIQTHGKVVYIDPAWVHHNFAKHPAKVIYSHYPQPMDGLPEKELPKADIILVTHHHQDHVKTATINRLAQKNTTIIAPTLCSELIARPFIPIVPGETKKIAGITIEAVHAYNTPEGHSTRKPHKKGECVGFIVTGEGKRIYHAGDTDVIPEMELFKDIAVAFLPIGGTFTMDVEEAVTAVNLIQPKMAIPMHYLHNNPDDFKKLAEKQTKSIIKVLAIGESIQF